MKKVFEFFKVPRNIYFSMIVMLTIVASLVSISFSYYVDESTNDTKIVKIDKVDNRIHSDSLNDGSITLLGNETKEIDLYVMSNNNFLTSYKLSYEVESNNVEVYSKNIIQDSIDANDVHKVTLIIENKDAFANNVKINIASGYNKNIKIDGKIINKK